MPKKLEYKVVMLGQGRVGKTSIARSWVYGDFDDSQASTIKALRYAKDVEVDGLAFTINIWDTAGQEEFHALTRSYYRNSNAALVVFGVDSKDSFQRVQEWIDEIQNNSPETVIIIVANKCDLKNERLIPTAAGKEFADKRELQYFEVSAKTSAGIDTLFNHLAKVLRGIKIKSSRHERNIMRDDSVDLKSDNTRDGSQCCK